MKRRYRFGADYYWRKLVRDIIKNSPKGTWPIVIEDKELVEWLRKTYLS